MSGSPPNSKRQAILLAGAIIISLAALGVAMLRYPVSLDAFWHLKMGGDWVQHGLSPWVDHYSFTFNGQPITNPPVAFQVLMHYAVQMFGIYPGFVVVRGLAYALTLILAVMVLRSISARPVHYAMILPLLVLALQFRVIVRPELLGYAFSVLALMLYFRADKKVNARSVVPMAILMLAWTNYHSSVVGYVIFAGFFLDCAHRQYLESAPGREWSAWLLWGLLVLSAGFLNPSWSHPLVDAVTFPAGWKVLITEYLPPQAFLKRNLAIYPIFLAAIVVPILAFRLREFGTLLVWGVLAYAGLTMQRMVTPAGIVITILMARLLVLPGPSGARTRAAGRSRASAVLLAFLVAAILSATISQAMKIMRENRGIFFRYPETMIDYMLRNGIEGRIFNTYGIGGYLAYYLYPGSQVYIDGRTQILYPIEHLLRYKEAERSLTVLREEWEKYGFGLIVTRFHRPLEDIYAGLDGFALDFADARYALYHNKAPNFPVHGILIAQPACWAPDMKEALAAERRLAQEILPANSALFPFADFVAGYAAAEDGAAYLDAAEGLEQWTDQMRRFAAFRMLEHSRYDEARILIGTVVAPLGPDYLAAATAMFRSGEYDLATSILGELSVSDWTPQYPEHELFHYLLYRELSTYRELEPGEIAEFERLEERVAESDAGPAAWDSSVSLLCTRPVVTAGQRHQSTGALLPE